MKKHLLYIFILLSVIACKKNSFSTDEYLSFISENKEDLVSKVTFGEFVYTSNLVPTPKRVIQQIYPDIKQESYINKLKEVDGVLQINFSIDKSNHNNRQNTPILNETNLAYVEKNISNDFYITYESKKYECVWAIHETSITDKNSLHLVLGFPIKLSAFNKENLEFMLVYNDDLFENGKIQFKYQIDNRFINPNINFIQ